MITKRQDVQFVDDPYDSWWYSPAGYLTKWVIVTAIFLFFSLWFVGGYMHAKRRLRKGLPLLAYHRWLVPAHMRYAHANGGIQNQFSFYQAQYARPEHGYYGGHNGNYGMAGYPEAPPAYTDPPPRYQPPPGGSKVNPHQGPVQANEQQAGPSQGMAPPPPPPPPADVDLPQRPKATRLNPMAKVREMMNQRR